LIQVSDEIEGFTFERAKARTVKIFDTTLDVLGRAATEGVPPSAAADRLAEQRMTEIPRLRSMWLPSR